MAQVGSTLSAGLFLPGTSVPAQPHVRWPQAAGASATDQERTRSRDPLLRRAYLDAALPAVARLIGAIDRNPYRPTHGCMDREYWHYRTSGFASGMYQEGALALAIVWATRLPGNPYFGNRRIAELAAAAIRFAARSSHADGSCDDYYPFERALGAAVFSLAGCAAAYRLLGLDDAGLLDWFRRRARWIAAHGESGRLANHHALAALALLRVAQATGEDEFRRAADAKIEQVLAWQDEEGWFDEYGGADLGYQTVTIDFLAKIRRATGDPRLDEPLRRAVEFARAFLHPDGSHGGVYGSRGTSHFYPHGFELLAGENWAAAELADGFLKNLVHRTEARLDDDRLFIHRTANLLEAYQDWSPTAAPSPGGAEGSSRDAGSSSVAVGSTRDFPRAGLVVRQSVGAHTVVSTARGGVFKHFAASILQATDAGLIVETADGRVAVSQMHDPSRGVEQTGESLTVAGPLHWARFETMSPAKQIVLHAVMGTVGRWCRTLMRKLLQQRLITTRRPAPIRHTRRFEWNSSMAPERLPEEHFTLRVTDAIELLDPRLNLKRMSFGTDHESAYVAATGGYDPGVLEPWTDLAEHVDRLNRDRRVAIVRQW
ncbi:MAG: hypothetical protein JW719_04975 [Pirellulales bacterium]|nr:hypothetical protein [Pirellulales bacterium]